MVNDMKKLVSAFNTIFDNTVKYFCYLAAATLVMTAIVISVDVILRYTLNKPLMWVFEGTEYALLFITFLSAAFDSVPSKTHISGLLRVYRNITSTDMARAVMTKVAAAK
jgi:TRAP-type C4-dicarboxylate transport system permease small subunit